MFREIVYEPAAAPPRGLRRLRAIADAWLDYLADPPFEGGCFLTAASVEFDGRPGPVNEAVKRTATRWKRVLEGEARIAIENGELPADRRPDGHRLHDQRPRDRRELRLPAAPGPRGPRARRARDGARARVMSPRSPGRALALPRLLSDAAGPPM